MFEHFEHLDYVWISLQAGTPIHEIGHALALSHEQKRYDRDDFVTVLWDNIIAGKEHNFDLDEEDKRTTMGTSYDYGSVMHYSVTVSNLILIW